MVGSRKKGRSLWKLGETPPWPSLETCLRSLPLEAPCRLYSLGLPRKVVDTSRLALWLPSDLLKSKIITKGLQFIQHPSNQYVKIGGNPEVLTGYGEDSTTSVVGIGRRNKETKALLRSVCWDFLVQSILGLEALLMWS